MIYKALREGYTLRAKGIGISAKHFTGFIAGAQCFFIGRIEQKGITMPERPEHSKQGLT